MKKSVYLKHAQKLYDSGAVSCEVYDVMLMNIDVFCDDEDKTEDAFAPKSLHKEACL